MVVELPKKYKVILKTLVGSRLHGTTTKGADYDYRGVFVAPLDEIFRVKHRIKTTSWIEGSDDNTSWEILPFLEFAIYCNPTILEVLKAPPIEITEEGEMVRRLFPHLISKERVFEAFRGYSKNQRKKWLENKDRRENKFAEAMVRVLWQGAELLEKGDFTVSFGKKDAEYLLAIKEGKIGRGEIFDEMRRGEDRMEDRYNISTLPEKPNKGEVNKVLYKVRMMNQKDLEGGELT